MRYGHFMHKVIEHILARRNMSVPINDGRNISLVMYGGSMAGVRGGAAVIALQDLGLAHVFDSIYATSSGFPNASYLLADSGKLGTSIYYENLITRDFINYLRPWNLVNIDHMIDVMRNKKKLDVDKIHASRTKLYAGLYDADKQQPEYLEIHDTKSHQYFDLIKAATSIHYLNPGTVTIDKKRYMDLPFHNDKYHAHHVQQAINSGATDILVVYNYHGQIKHGHPLPDNVYEITPPEEWRLSRFETRPSHLKEAALQMGQLVKATFGVDEGIDLRYINETYEDRSGPGPSHSI